MDAREKYVHKARMIRMLELRNEVMSTETLESHLVHAELIANADYKKQEKKEREMAGCVEPPTLHPEQV